MKEKLVRIPGFLNYYTNELGEVWEWSTNNWHLIKQTTTTNGYLTVRLMLPSGRKKRFLVHRLVCIAFHGYQPQHIMCCHRNDIKSDNTANNLYWGTPANNSNDYQRNKNNPDYKEAAGKINKAKLHRLYKRVVFYLQSRIEHVTEKAILDEMNRIMCLRKKKKPVIKDTFWGNQQ